jgi:hypothetical protein
MIVEGSLKGVKRGRGSLGRELAGRFGASKKLLVWIMVQDMLFVHSSTCGRMYTGLKKKREFGRENGKTGTWTGVFTKSCSH